MLLKLKSVFKNAFSSSFNKWSSAQIEEAKFWEGISKTGYNNQSPEDFIKDTQKKDMLAALSRICHPINYWLDKTVIEFGPGPAGIIEYIDAKNKIGIEPLYHEYLEMFPHLKKSKVKYYNVPAEDTEFLNPQSADLAICYNMLDHVMDPVKILNNIFKVLKCDAPLLFQINVYDSEQEINNKSGVHAELHPHSFTRDSIVELLNHNGFKIESENLFDHLNECGERYFICVCNKTN